MALGYRLLVSGAPGTHPCAHFFSTQMLARCLVVLPRRESFLLETLTGRFALGVLRDCLAQYGVWRAVLQIGDVLEQVLRIVVESDGESHGTKACAGDDLPILHQWLARVQRCPVMA
ncbi:hypothetical protein PSAC2689_30133 [Paraburkholderia sacchari]